MSDFGIWYLAGIILLIAPVKYCMYIGLIMLGASIGGNGQFGPVLLLRYLAVRISVFHIPA